MSKDCKQSKQITCKEQHCAHCGWDPKEAARRGDLIRCGGLSKGAIGKLATLHLARQCDDGLTCEEV